MITLELRDAVLGWRTEPMVFEVEKGAIKRYAEVLGDANPLWTDEIKTRKSSHAELAAMPIFLAYFNPFHWGAALPYWGTQLGLRVSASAGDEFEFYHPVRTGDVITVTERFMDIYERQGRKGMLMFTVDERTYTNQRTELVGRSHWTRSHWAGVDRTSSPATNGTGSTVLPEPPPRFHEYVRQRPPEFEIAATFPSGKQVCFEDVEPGMDIPPLVRNLSHELFVRYAACNNEFSRHHVDYLYAAAVGWRDCISMGLMGTCYLSKLMTDWIGEEGLLRRLKATYRAPGYPGDTWTCKGKVTNKYEHDGENWVDCELWVENQDGAIVTPGSATVALPSRG
jgi:acyl dehydratase